MSNFLCGARKRYARKIRRKATVYHRATGGARVNHVAGQYGRWRHISAKLARKMAEDLLKKWAIDGMVAAVEHIRDCERCRRIYGAAFDVLRQEGAPLMPNPWTAYFQCSYELHGCDHWPKGI